MSFDFFSKHFPPEKFLKPPHIGISFSDFNIKAVYFDKKNKKQSLKSAIMPIEKGCIVDGRVVKADEIIKKLSVIRKDFGLPFVFFALPDELAYVFSITIPVNNQDNASESVAFIMEENVPLSLADTVFDFVPIEISRSENEYLASVVVSACPKKEVEKFADIFKKSGFEMVGCLHESQTITNALLPKNSKGFFSIIHARENRVGIYLVRDNLVTFVTLRPILGEYEIQFLDEYKKFLEYCMKLSEVQNKPIQTVFVCGDFEYAKKIVEIINKTEDIGEAKLANVWTNVFKIDKRLPDIPYEKSLSFAGPIGAVLSEI